MRTSGVFALGAIMGAAVVWLWGRQMEQYAVRGGEDAPGAHEGSRGRSSGRREGRAGDRGADALHRADDFLQDTKERVSEALRAGQEAVRP